MGFLLSSRTDASLPYWDSTTTVLSIAAQYLLAQKKLENFLVWMVVNVLSIGIYIYKDLFLTSGLYFTFLILVIIGFFSWRKNLTKSPTA
jgi:nicotinamide mononucleotide transporter